LLMLAFRFGKWSPALPLTSPAAELTWNHGCKSRGATGAIAPPRIFQDGLNVA